MGLLGGRLDQLLLGRHERRGALRARGVVLTLAHLHDERVPATRTGEGLRECQARKKGEIEGELERD